MYAIIVYDVAVERVTKVCHFLRRYLNWTQNSSFEGELSKSELKLIQEELKKIIDEKTDCVQLYLVQRKALVKKKVLGTPKAVYETVI